MKTSKYDSLTESEDYFKKSFKYYKSNNPKPSLQNVIIVDCCSDKVSCPTNVHDLRVQLLGLQSLSKWRMHSFSGHPGLLLIRNPFTGAGQRYWIKKCLKEYPRKPNKTNIDIEIVLQDWWTSCFENGQCNRQLQKKLRWTTLGFHHNWDTKIYSDENKSTFPEELTELSDVVAGYLGYNNFKAEAAIVNYYHRDSTLSPHTDHSEVNLEAPLFSFSFGQSAIFLIGGQDKTVEPSAILLNSGDIVIMSKEARLCYHAVPKILPATSTPWNDLGTTKVSACNISDLKYVKTPERIVSEMKSNADNSEWSNYNTYIEESRINMNVRQVLNERQQCLMEPFNDTIKVQ